MQDLWIWDTIISPHTVTEYVIFSKIRVHVEFGSTMQTSWQFDDIAYVQHIDANV